jgi:hypothetical protein
VLADLEDWGVKVISATEGDEPLRGGIQLVVAEDYSRKLAERVCAAFWKCAAGQIQVCS